MANSLIQCQRLSTMWALIALLLFLAASTGSAYDPTQSKAILSITHFNDDATADTLLGYAVKIRNRWQLRPECIRWGFDTTTPGGISLPLKKANTWFVYPNWSDIKCIAAVDKFDADTMSDIAFVFSGTYTSGASVRDTARAVHLFGQRDLITIDTVRLALINNLQETPYVVTRLFTGTNFIEPEFRDVSSITSYLFVPPALSDTAGSPKRREISEEPWEIRLYPNPATTAAQLEASKLPPGQYTVKILSMQGALVYEQELVVQHSREITETIRLADLTTGCYILRIYSDTACIGSYPFIIVH